MATAKYVLMLPFVECIIFKPFFFPPGMSNDRVTLGHYCESRRRPSAEKGKKKQKKEQENVAPPLYIKFAFISSSILVDH